jgi:hypothetical protein
MYLSIVLCNLTPEAELKVASFANALLQDSYQT